MSADLSAAGPGRAPLLGHNLVRLLYLDEAGTDNRAPLMCVAGAIVHGDKQWPEIDRRIQALIDQYIPENDRRGFVFHATDIFHGSRYFDRRKPDWPKERRFTLLGDLAQIIADLSLPLVVGFYKKTEFAVMAAAVGATDVASPSFMHNVAALDCLIWADRWLEKFSPAELAVVVHEDGSRANQVIKHSLRAARGDYALVPGIGLPPPNVVANFPLKRIVDTIHWAEKPDARPLQLADLAAFIFCRSMNEQPVPEHAFEVVFGQLRWMIDYRRAATWPAISASPKKSE